jgi:hypothetical protein
MRPKILSLFPLMLICVAAIAQSPTPIVVQAASGTAVTSTSSKAVAAAPDVHSIPDAIKLLEQIKAANDEVLAKQKASLERLDELQDAAEQLRIFAKRG